MHFAETGMTFETGYTPSLRAMRFVRKACFEGTLHFAEMGMTFETVCMGMAFETVCTLFLPFYLRGITPRR